MAAAGTESATGEESQQNSEVLLKLKQMDGTVHEVTAPVAWTVTQLKSEVARVAGVPAERQRLVFQGRVLQETTILRDLSLPSGACIHLVTRPDTADAPPPPPAAAPLFGAAQPFAAAPAQGQPPLHAIVRQLDAGGAVGQLMQGVLQGLFPNAQGQQQQQPQQQQQQQQQQTGAGVQGHSPQPQQQQQQTQQQAQQREQVSIWLRPGRPGGHTQPAQAPAQDPASQQQQQPGRGGAEEWDGWSESEEAVGRAGAGMPMPQMTIHLHANVADLPTLADDVYGFYRRLHARQQSAQAEGFELPVQMAEDQQNPPAAPSPAAPGSGGPVSQQQDAGPAPRQAPGRADATALPAALVNALGAAARSPAVQGALRAATPVVEQAVEQIAAASQRASGAQQTMSPIPTEAPAPAVPAASAAPAAPDAPAGPA